MEFELTPTLPPCCVILGRAVGGQRTQEYHILRTKPTYPRRRLRWFRFASGGGGDMLLTRGWFPRALQHVLRTHLKAHARELGDDLVRLRPERVHQAEKAGDVPLHGGDHHGAAGALFPAVVP